MLLCYFFIVVEIMLKIIISLILTSMLVVSPQVNAESIKQKKLSFFEYVYPLIESENISILKNRKQLIAIKQTLLANNPLQSSEQDLLIALMKKYKLTKRQDSTVALVDQLLIKIDVIPPSLALAQSANESAWGKSRFARQANNYFGQWCFSKGCGIVPKQRSANSRHEVRRFDSVQSSVRSYIKNINTTRPYSELRKMRHKLRLNNHNPDGHKLAEGLLRYSSRGMDYVKEIRAMIRQNKLIKYDQRFWSAIKNIESNKSI